MNASYADQIQEARMAVELGDHQRAGAILHRILKDDITHPGAWDVLYESLGRGESYEDFRQSFAQKYYPGAAHRLVRSPDNGTTDREAPYRRVSLIPDRQFGDSPPPGKPDPLRPKTGPIPQTRRIETPPESATAPGAQAEPAGRNPGFLRRLFGAFRARLGRKPTNEAASIGFDVFPDVASKSEARGGLSLKDLPLKAEILPRPPKSTRSRESQPLLSSLGERNEIRVLIADDIQQTRDNIRRLLRFEPNIEVVDIAANGDEAVEKALLHQPDIVLMDINMPGMDGLQALKLIRENLPATQVVMLTVQDDPGYLREALQYGARDYLIKPPMIDDLLETIHQTHQIGQAERERLMKMAAPPAIEKSAGVDRKPGFAVAFYSPKGGVGCTLLAANLAVSLHTADEPVVLVDCSLHFGGIGLFFNEQGRNSIVDLAPRALDLDLKVLHDATVLHEASGVRLVLAPNRPEKVGSVTGQQIADLIRYLRSAYSFVIVDTSSVLDDHTIAVLEACDHIFLVATQDIPAILDIRRTLNLAPHIGLSPEKISIVLNMVHSRVNITPEQIKSNLKHDLAGIVPLDNRTAVPSVNRGIPFMVEPAARSQPIGQALEGLADRVRSAQRAASDLDL